MKYTILAVLVAFAFSSVAMEYRAFTDKEGREIKAKIIKVDVRSRKITLERDNRKIATVPLNIFSEADQAYIKEWLVASDFQMNSKFKIKVDDEKDKVDDKKTTLTYDVELDNRTSMKLDNVRVEYAIFVRTSGFNGSNDSEKVFTGTLDFQSLEKGQKRLLATSQETLSKTFRSYQYEDSYSDAYNTYTITKTGYKKSTEDKLSGIWLKVYGPEVGGQQICRDFTEPSGLEKKVTWPKSKF